jgi:sporulation protein YlmC with PRC-barrel domain
MNEFARRMHADEFWLSGWGTGAYGTLPAPQSTEAPAGVPPAGGTLSPASPDGSVTMDPRGQTAGIDAPRAQIRALYSAGRVLAHRRDSEGCEYILAKMNEIYDGYSQQLQEAGVDPASVTTWREEQLALARPLADGEGMAFYRSENIVGTDVRNVRDENLGSVADVIIDPHSATATYLLVARSGFLGIGEEHYAIPWGEVRATPGLDTIVIDRTEAEIEQAPAIDPDRFRNPETMTEERRATDEFWSQQG